jgi:hypothetical protein
MAQDTNQKLIAALGSDLSPVRRLAPPALRAFGWLALVVVVAIALAATADDHTIAHRLSAMPDMWLAASGSALTAILAAIAAFQLGLPDRSRAWALLPLPAMALWIAASGVGCMRINTIPDTTLATLSETRNCLMFIVGLSLPLSVALVFMLRRGFSMQPGLTAAIGGLGCAAAAATLLNFIHPYDVSVADLGVHAFAIAMVVVVNRVLSGRLLTAKNLPVGR